MWFLFGFLAVVCACIAVYQIVTGNKGEGGPLDSQVATTQSKGSPDMNRWAARREVKSSQARTTLNTQLTSEVEARTQLEAGQMSVLRVEHDLREATARLEEARAKEIANHNRDMTLIANEQQIIEKATRDGLHAQTYLATEHQRQLDHLDFEKKERESKLRVEEHRQMQEIEVDIEFKKAMSTLAAIARFRHLQYDAFDEIRGRINTLLEEEYKIEMSQLPLELKIKQLENVTQAIQTYKVIYDAKRDRLLESGDRETVEGYSSLTELVRVSRPSIEGDNDELRIKVAGNRSREGSTGN
jgi:hypothetical protein